MLFVTSRERTIQTPCSHEPATPGRSTGTEAAAGCAGWPVAAARHRVRLLGKQQQKAAVLMPATALARPGSGSSSGSGGGSGYARMVSLGGNTSDGNGSSAESGGIGFGFDVRDLADDDPGSSVRQRWRQRCASVVVGGNGDTNAVTALGG